MSAEGTFVRAGRTLHHGPCERSWVEDALGRAPRSVVEGGAYDGGDAIRYHLWWPEATVISIEADPLLYPQVEANCAAFGDGRIQTIHAALWSEPTTKPFYRAFYCDTGIPSGSSSVYSRTQESRRQWASKIHWAQVPTCEVSCITLDSLGLTELDFLHLDVEGAEQDVLRGLGGLRPKVMMLEKHVDAVAYATAPHYRTTKEYAHSLGYRLFLQAPCDDIYVLETS